MKTGKESKYINSNNYVGQIAEENYDSETPVSQLDDSIRYFSKNFWTLQNDNLVNANKINDNNMFVVSSIKDDVLLLTANKNKFLSDKINNFGILERNFDPKKWQLFTTLNIPSSNQVFYDYHIKLQEPVDLFENKDTGESAVSYIKKDFKYNFFSPSYENIVNDRAFDIKVLPTMFSLLNDKKLDSRTYEENLDVTLGGLIPDDYAESLFLATSYNDTVKRYFENYSKVYESTDSRFVFSTISGKNDIVKINKDKTSLLKKSTFVPFPFYVKANFSNLANNKQAFIHQLDNFDYAKEELLDFIIDQQFNLTSQKFIYTSDYSEERDIAEYDVKTWLDYGVKSLFGSHGRSNHKYSAIVYTNLINHIKDNIKPKTRKYSELSSEQSYSELLFYKIEKRQFNFDRADPIQTYWFTPDDGELITFIDTQIKYATDYYYTIKACLLVVGNEYFYEPYDYSGNNAQLLKLDDIANGKFRVKVNNKASYKILEIPFTKFLASIHENPYTKPIIKVQKDKNNIRFNIEPSQIDSMEEMRIVENNDFQIFENIKISQNNENKELISSRVNDSDKVTLQVYKTTNKPLNYLGFQGKLFKTLILSNDATFTDSIVPEIKYYYMFRYLNNHNTPSNISKIYEVIMKVEEDNSYLEVKELDLEMTMEKKTTKDFKKYLLIRPSVIQTFSNVPNNARSAQDIVLGPERNSVWNKDFVLRLTSKKTNRVIEFNLKSIIKR